MKLLFAFFLLLALPAAAQTTPALREPTAAELMRAAVRDRTALDSLSQEFDQQIIANDQLRKCLYNEIDESMRLAREVKRLNKFIAGGGVKPYYYTRPVLNRTK